jgi:hypothetical protein
MIIVPIMIIAIIPIISSSGDAMVGMLRVGRHDAGSFSQCMAAAATKSFHRCKSGSQLVLWRQRQVACFVA